MADIISNKDQIVFEYVNWQAKRGVRRVRSDIQMVWKSTEWHPEEQWLMVAHDLDKDAERSFAIKDIVKFL